MPAESQEQETVPRAVYRGHWASEEQGARLASAAAEALLSCSQEVTCMEKATREGKMKTFPNPSPRTESFVVGLHSEQTSRAECQQVEQNRAGACLA